MSVKVYEEKMFMLDVYNKLAAAEAQAAKGKVLDGDATKKAAASSKSFPLLI